MVSGPDHLLGKMEIVIQPLPRRHLLDGQPGRTVRQRRKEPEPPHQHGHDHGRGRPGGEQGLAGDALADGLGAGAALLGLGLLAATLGLLQLNVGEVGDVRGFDVKDEFDDGAGDESRGEVGGQVVVQEELAAHDEEGEVVGGPEEEEEAGAVVQSRSCA